MTPKKIDPQVRERAVRLLLEHRSEYLSSAKAIAAVARQEGVGAESLRRWVIQAEIDAGSRDGQTSEEHAEIRRLKAENKRLREDVATLKAATLGSSFFSLLQKNVLDRHPWPTRLQLRLAIVQWIERIYHRKRRQRRLGKLTPIEFETIMMEAVDLAA